MSHLLVHVSDLCPQGCVILLALRQNAGLAPVACNTSKLLLPKAVYRFATTDKLRGKGRTFSILDGTHGEMMIEIEIDGAAEHSSFLRLRDWSFALDVRGTEPLAP